MPVPPILPLLGLAFYAIVWRRRNWPAAAGWMALLAGCAGMASQAWWYFGGGQTRYSGAFSGGDLMVLAVILPHWWSLQISGGSVQALFEATASSVGPRQSTMDPYAYFMLLVYVKVALLGTLAWLGVRAAPSPRRTGFLGALLVLVLLDGWWGRDWPWWGT